jgi:hypothetical protein
MKSDEIDDYFHALKTEKSISIYEEVKLEGKI